jgi:hypothetical protein
MKLAERWGWAILIGAIASTAVASLRADPGDPEPLRRVELMLVGPAGQDPTLDDRVRSLFDRQTRVVTHRVSRLAPVAVLEPESANTLYLWIAVGPDRARVYVAIRPEQSKSPHYLFRDVELETGMDEVGSETLAQVAHSSAAALWGGGPETSKQELETELAREVEPAALSERTAPGNPSAASPVREGRGRRPSPAPAARAAGSPPAWELTVGVQEVEHLAGDEGRLDEPGALAMLGWRDRVGLRALATYLVPKRFSAGSAEVRLKGVSSDLRVACFLGPPSGPRARVEVGAGALFIDWNPTVAPSAVSYPAGRDTRGYAVGALGGELPLGPLRVGARLELRVPFRKTAYDWVEPQRTTRVAESSVSPGAALEVGLPLTRF